MSVNFILTASDRASLWGRSCCCDVGEIGRYGPHPQKCGGHSVWGQCGYQPPTLVLDRHSINVVVQTLIYRLLFNDKDWYYCYCLWEFYSSMIYYNNWCYNQMLLYDLTFAIYFQRYYLQYISTIYIIVIKRGTMITHIYLYM